MPGVSYANADIWANWEQFEAAAKTLESEAGKLADAARSGDNAAIKAQFDAFGGACGGCHKPFRIKKDG
jgi:cytochrome c556